MAVQFAKLNKGATPVITSGGYGFFKLSKGGGGSGAVDFATDDWSVVQAEAKRISLAGTADGSPYSVGDTRDITLSTNEVITAVILGFNHDTLTTAYDNGGTFAGISIGMDDSLTATRRMNASDTNYGGWTASEMRRYMATYLSQLPIDLQNVIEPVNKLTSKGYTALTTLETTVDSLWLLSYSEIMGTIYKTAGSKGAEVEEGRQYSYYKNAIVPTGFSRISETSSVFVGTGATFIDRFNRTITTRDTSYYNYNASRLDSMARYTRSPKGNIYFAAIETAGYSWTTYPATYPRYVAYAFCI